MATGTIKLLAAMATLVGLGLYSLPAAHADPMKCSGEEKVCITNCSKAATMPLSTCLTNCGARKSYCFKTGCWNNGAQSYCGLAKQ